MIGNEYGSLRERFDRKFVACPMSGCWLWTGAVMGNGYGKIHRGGDHHRKKELAHRIAYELYVAPVADDSLVLHRCDVPSCVNPAHLFLGTEADNMQDMHAKGRGTRGERTNFAKLTEGAVKEIRASRDTAGVLAEKYGVSVAQIYRVVKGTSWKWASP